MAAPRPLDVLRSAIVPASEAIVIAGEVLPCVAVLELAPHAEHMRCATNDEPAHVLTIEPTLSSRSTTTKLGEAA